MTDLKEINSLFFGSGHLPKYFNVVGYPPSYRLPEFLVQAWCTY